MSLTLHGIGVSKGIAIGKVHLITRSDLEVTEYQITIEQLETEVSRFEDALDIARKQLHRIRERIPLIYPASSEKENQEIASFIDPHLLMLQDTMLTQIPIELMEEKRCNAEWALQIQRDRLVSVFEAMEDPYLQARKSDVDQVINRVQTILLGHHEDADDPEAPLHGRIVLADDLTPADTLLMQHEGITALITDYGGATSHTAILARSLGIPAIVGLRHARRYIQAQDTLIVDGGNGVVMVKPDRRSERYYRNRRRMEKQQRSQLGRLKDLPTATLDGTAISLHANIEQPEDISVLKHTGVDGVGLFRTEFLYLRGRDQIPDEEEHYQAYATVIHALKGGTLTIRTIDIGADKGVHLLPPRSKPTANPALSLRAVRLCLKNPHLFKPQLRAILRASALGSVRLMVPMVSGLQELLQVRELLEAAQAELDAEGILYNPKMPVGVMVEIPSLAICTDLFTPYVDFLSIGTNDLIQYTLAVDRVDDEVGYLYEPLHPAVLRLLKIIIRAAADDKTPVSMCGEMAGDRRYIRLLLGMGLRSFSVNPKSILEVKEIITGSNLRSLTRLTNKILKTAHQDEINALLEQLNRGIESS